MGTEDLKVTAMSISLPQNESEIGIKVVSVSYIVKDGITLLVGIWQRGLQELGYNRSR